MFKDNAKLSFQKETNSFYYSTKRALNIQLKVVILQIDTMQT